MNGVFNLLLLELTMSMLRMVDAILFLCNA